MYDRNMNIWGIVSHRLKNTALQLSAWHLEVSHSSTLLEAKSCLSHTQVGMETVPEILTDDAEPREAEG